MKIIRISSLIVLSLIFALAPLTTSPTIVEAASTCNTSSPSSGAYRVTLCFTSPTSSATLSGDTSTAATVSISGTNPGVQRVVFYISGAYLLTDFQSAYVFTLPTTKWTDGNYTLSVQALMRDGFTTSQTSMSVKFSNGIKKPPVNNNVFTPTSGTTPDAGAPFLVAATGDGASGEVNSSRVSDLISSYSPNLFLYLGDVYEKGSVAEFYNWYGTDTTFFGRLRAITDPTIGNHEYEKGAAPGYFDYWDNIPNYYSFDAGGWHFVSLNSNSAYVSVSKGSAQYNWLQQDLSANSQLCTVVYYHHPLFNIGPEGSKTSMADIWSLMAQYGVSIVINGHDHDYQRWVPLDANGNPSPTGITEFVAGGGGHGTQTITNTDSRVAYSNYLNPTAIGTLFLQLNASGASFNYVNTSGSILDSGVVSCAKSGPDTQAPTTPGNLSASAASATQVNLSWSASSDNVGVSGYTIYRDGTAIGTAGGSSLSYSDITAMPATIYQYSIDAFDSAGNYSAQTSPVNATTPVLPPSLIFGPSADTYVNSGSPNSNYGSATTIRLDASPDLHGYLKFNVQGTAGTPIVKAILSLYANNNSSLGINALIVNDTSWNEKTMTYNNAPPLGNLISASGSYKSGTWINLDVTSYITGESTFSFGLTTQSTSALSFPSQNSGVNYAQLTVYFQASDSTPPSTPTGLTATVSSNPNQVSLAWSASTDNVGVDGYTLYRDGAVLATLAGDVTSYVDSTVIAGTYNYTVDAFDAAGNHSAQSAAAPAVIPDTTAPTVPGGLTVGAASARQVDLSWTPSTDDVGVSGYTVYRDGSVVTTVSGSTLSYSDTTVSASSTYSYTVDAFDAAGNYSAQTDPVSVTTPSMPTSVTFTPDADSYVNSGSPGSNYGTSTALRVDASPIVNSYLRFSVQGLSGHTVARARLMIYANSGSSAGLIAWIVADNTWGETTITYNNAPAFSSSIASSGAVTSGTWITLDVTSYITGEGTFSIGVSTPGATAISLAARESGANSPQLIIDLN